MAKRIAILIGNGAFAEPEELPPLEGPRNDVEQLAQVLGDEERGGFQTVRCIDEEHHTILSKIERHLKGAGKDDFVLIYYSGHGKRNANGQLCLAAANTRSDVLNSTSILFPNLKQLTEDSKCENVLLVLDCCFSGAVSTAYGIRGGIANTLEHLAQETAGLHILTSSASYQASQEREHEHSGMVMGDFTACLLEGLESGEADEDRDGEIRLSELRSYVQKHLRGQTAQYWGFRVFGDPLISQNPELKRQRRVVHARRRLAEWNRERKIPNDVFFATLDFLPDDGEAEAERAADRDHLVDLLLDPRCQPAHFLAQWEAVDPQYAAQAPKPRPRESAAPAGRRTQPEAAATPPPAERAAPPAPAPAATPRPAASPLPPPPDAVLDGVRKTEPVLLGITFGGGFIVGVMVTAIAMSAGPKDDGYSSSLYDTSAVVPYGDTMTTPVTVPTVDTGYYGGDTVEVTTTTEWDTVWGDSSAM